MALGFPYFGPASVWIVEDSDFESAMKFVEEYSRRESPEPAATWQCPTCGEHIQEQFDACWKCNSEPERG